MRLVAAVAHGRCELARKLQVEWRGVTGAGLQLGDHVLVHRITRTRSGAVDGAAGPYAGALSMSLLDGSRDARPKKLRKNRIKTNLIPNCLAVND